MDGVQDSTTAGTDMRSKVSAPDDQKGPASPNTVDAVEGSSPVKTFWRFGRPSIPGRVALTLERVSNSTATTIYEDFSILRPEAYRIVAAARYQELPLRVVKDNAPNLAHWSSDRDLEDFMNLCPSSGAADEVEAENLVLFGRRKRVPVTDFLDNLMAVRLGLALETVRSYRQRGQRAARKRLEEGKAQADIGSELSKS